jgi:2-polyprenyl-3-methyl-5-hydroxy-6-metoxy-1,4-benzoquinol methylase
VTEARWSSSGVVHGNVYDKYGTHNPVARRLQSGFERAMDELLARAGRPASVLEVGCGEGHVTARLARRFPDARVIGRDVSPEVVALASRLHPGLRFEARSIYEPGDGDERWDLVVACEVLEHLDDPDRALDAIARVASGCVFVSVPREPLWRILNLARARYLRDLGNTPGHLQHWSRGAFLALLGRRFEVLDTRAPLPWTQALCRVRP